MNDDTTITPVPITILTGFLGAGKTTLLNRILHADHGLKVAVMVNDFGSINIDTQLVVGVEGEAISLANGCICCSIRDDLLLTALNLLKRPDPPEYLMIEASGVSDPWAIAETFQLPELRPFFNVDGVITVVDAEYVRQNEHYESLIVDQISAADIVVLSKIDLVDEAQRADVDEWVRRIVPRARILPAVHGDVPFNLLLGVGRYKIELTPTVHGHAHHAHEHHDHEHEHHDHAHEHHDHEHEHHDHEHEHHDHEHEHHDHEHHDHTHHVHGPDCNHDHEHNHGSEFSSWSYTTHEPLSLHALREVIMGLPPTIFRAKGIIYLADIPHRRAILQAVGVRVTVKLAEAWGETIPTTQLVFLSTPGALDADELQAAFDSCRVPAPTNDALAPLQTWLRQVTA